MSWLALPLSAAIGLAAPHAATAQTPVTLANAYTHAIHSQVNGVDYQLTVVLPPNYDRDKNVRYPTFYVMDGNRWAQLLAVLMPRLELNSGYPPIIVVGVDYQGKTGRYQDYGPVSQRYFPVPENRGNANYMRVLKEEVIPLIDKTYRTDPQDRGIGGHSMGGFFTAYALLHETDTFDRFWISSPSLFYDNEYLLSDFKDFQAKHLKRKLYVFTDVGGNELPSMKSAIERFGQKVTEAQPGNVLFATRQIDGFNHATVVPAALTLALDHLYHYRPYIIPTNADLLRFAGQYQTPAGTILSFLNDGQDLLYRDSTVEHETGSLIRLSASAPNRFYEPQSSREFEFQMDGATLKSVRVIDTTTNEVVEAVRLPSRDYQGPKEVRVGKP